MPRRTPVNYNSEPLRSGWWVALQLSDGLRRIRYRARTEAEVRAWVERGRSRFSVACVADEDAEPGWWVDWIRFSGVLRCII